jgi:uncharacterized membrane protein
VVDVITSLEAVFALSGAFFVLLGVARLADRNSPARVGTALFWILLGVAFAFGGVLPAWATGAIVIAMVVIDGLGSVQPANTYGTTDANRARTAMRLGWRIFVPVLMIPALTYSASLVPWGQAVDLNRIVFVSFGYASILAALVAVALTRARAGELVEEGRRLADAVGPVVILPQLLASLGSLFNAAGVGTVIAGLASMAIPTGNLLAVILVCCVSITIFTFIMGNSFAAFPVIMAGIGVPLLVRPFQADAAQVAAIVLTCASCGTLCTPMAANFNMVPANLFGMRDEYGIIRFQAPYAAAMFVVHVVLLWALVAGSS